MSSRNQKDKAKNIQEKYQMILSRLLREEDNKYCADCDAKGKLQRAKMARPAGHGAVRVGRPRLSVWKL